MCSNVINKNLVAVHEHQIFSKLYLDRLCSKKSKTYMHDFVFWCVKNSAVVFFVNWPSQITV